MTHWINQSINPIYLTWPKQQTGPPAMGHWGTSPLDFQLFNFSGHFSQVKSRSL